MELSLKKVARLHACIAGTGSNRNAYAANFLLDKFAANPLAFVEMEFSFYL